MAMALQSGRVQLKQPRLQKPCQQQLEQQYQRWRQQGQQQPMVMVTPW
jgi:hypothetical protein